MSKPLPLFYRDFGKGEPIVILHGLFGSSDNWLSQGKILSEKYRVILVDLRNHGQSPHDEANDYPTMAGDVKALLDLLKIKPIHLMGHSMGGKVAIQFSLLYPEYLKSLTVVDIAPKKYPMHHDRIMEGLKAIPIQTLESRNMADSHLQNYVSNQGIRQFLLKNLQRMPDGHFQWKINIPILERNLGYLLGMEFSSGVFDKPSLFIRGARSNYVEPGDEKYIFPLFPTAQIVSLDTGHWVHSEKPEEFLHTVFTFLETLKA